VECFWHWLYDSIYGRKRSGACNSSVLIQPLVIATSLSAGNNDFRFLFPEQLSTLVPARKTSKSCVDSVALRKRDDGETWSSNCYICSCRHGDVVCDLLKCPVLACRSPVQLEGHCCPVCESGRFFSSAFSKCSRFILTCRNPYAARVFVRWRENNK